MRLHGSVNGCAPKSACLLECLSRSATEWTSRCAIRRASIANPGPRHCILNVCTEMVRRYDTLLVRMEPGNRYTSHRHSDIEELLVLSGQLHVKGRPMHTGDYCRAESGTFHGETYTNSGCLFLLLASQGNNLFSEKRV